MPRFAANLSFLFAEHDFLGRFAAAADAGFKAVEFAFPYNFDAAAIRAQLDRHGLHPVLFNLPPGDWAAGERGLACLPDRVDTFRKSVEAAVGYAKAIGCRQLHCMAGIAPTDRDAAEIRRTLVDNLRFAAGALSSEGVALVIEPINTRDMPGYALHHSRDAIDIIAEIGPERIGLQYDIYHMQVMEGDLAPTIAANLPLIRHIQVADTPGRHEPGTGEINYRFLFGHLDAIGYTGWVGCEYHPLDGTLNGLGWRDRGAGR